MDEDTRRRDVAMHPPQVMDRVTFCCGDDSLRTGYVAAVERNEASGDWIIWVEPEHDFSAGFTAITRHELVDSDNSGAQRRTLADEALWLHLALCDFKR